jgi:hypothetical protein
MRAALISLLTAALAHEGTAAIIGEAEGGWRSDYRRGHCHILGRQKDKRA